MKIIKQKCGKKVYDIYEIELDRCHFLRISPAEVDIGETGALYTLKIVRPDLKYGFRDKHRTVSIPPGKLEEIAQAIKLAIKEVKKRPKGAKLPGSCWS